MTPIFAVMAQGNGLRRLIPHYIPDFNMACRLNRNAERRPHPPCEDQVVRIEFESFLKLPHSVNIGSKNQLKVIEIEVGSEMASLLRSRPFWQELPGMSV